MKSTIHHLFTGGLLVTALLTNLAGCKKDEFPQPKAKEAWATINGEKVKFPNGGCDTIIADSTGTKRFGMSLKTDKYRPNRTGKTLIAVDFSLFYSGSLPLGSKLVLPGQLYISSSQTSKMYAIQYAEGDIQESCDHYVADTLADNWIKINSYDKESGLVCGEFGGKLCATQYYCKDFPEVLEITNGSFCVYMNE